MAHWVAHWPSGAGAMPCDSGTWGRGCAGSVPASAWVWDGKWTLALPEPPESALTGEADDATHTQLGHGRVLGEAIDGADVDSQFTGQVGGRQVEACGHTVGWRRGGPPRRIHRSAGGMSRRSSRCSASRPKSRVRRGHWEPENRVSASGAGAMPWEGARHGGRRGESVVMARPEGLAPVP
jgi:hypothetical protein